MNWDEGYQVRCADNLRRHVDVKKIIYMMHMTYIDFGDNHDAFPSNP